MVLLNVDPLGGVDECYAGAPQLEGGSSLIITGGGDERNFCRAGVKMRMVPSMDAMRKAHRKILSNTWATNFQSCTT
jgi:hypothetical protein